VATPGRAINIDSVSRYRGCLLGLACGDAVGTTVEFSPRGSFDTVTDMVGEGPFGLKAGQWTDDTSMALCLAASLVENKQFDAHDQMTRYCRWRDDGYMSSTGDCFDIGGTVARALSAFQRSNDPFSGSPNPESAGNGCIMRLAPVPMFFHPDRVAAIHMSGESARTTHGAPECIDASRLFGAMLFQSLSGATKEEILFGHGVDDLTTPKVKAVARGKYRNKSQYEIRGTGYVVESLEAALWCFDTTDNFRDAILTAANLGDDADTTAAVCGQIAGAHYGKQGIPSQWLKKLAMRSEIERLADALHGRDGGRP